jgi:hypothetical protein
MKLPATPLLLAALFALSPAVQAQAHGHSHDHGSAEAPASLHLNAGKKWQTDAPLRGAMGRINGAMARALPRIHQERFSDADYVALAATVNKEVAYAVEHCKLDAEADPMLHLVIADLLAGAEVMQGQEGTARHDGAVKVVKALQAYGNYFAHPGWKPARG